MDFQVLKKQYPNEWLLVEYEGLDELLHVTRGRVLAHSANKDEIYRLLGKSFGKNLTVEYTGPHDQELTVMFLLR